MRPIKREISLGGSPAVGGCWDDVRLADADDELVVRELHDGSGWHYTVVDGDDREVGRLAHIGNGARAWIWAVKHGPSAYAPSRRRRWRSWRGIWRGSAAMLSCAPISCSPT